MKPLRFLAAIVSHCLLAGLFALASIELCVETVTLPDLKRLGDHAALVYADDGEILNTFQSTDDKLRLPAHASEVDPRYLSLLLAYEDRNFLDHRGVDFGALLRAARLAAQEGRVVSGASTLTMQLVRLLDPKPRTIPAKLTEMMQALALERRHSKSRILDAYLTVAPFGGNIEGVRAASLIYFGKEPKTLSLEEAALLVALPQSPETRRPDRSATSARAARDRVLDVLSRREAIAASDATQAMARPLSINADRFAQLASHLATRFKGLPGTGGDIHTLIDAVLQRKLEQLAREAVASWEPGVEVAFLVVRNIDGAVVGYVGSADTGDRTRHTYVDLVRAVRSPGSTLKPFIFAMAFENLLVHPDTLVADQPIDIAGYRPDNADGQFAGDISIRQSLLLSKNTVPVMLLDNIGVGAFLSRFRTIGSPLQLAASDSEAGLAVALGGVGATLEQLVWFYSAFANEGELKQLRYLQDDPGGTLGDLFGPSAANAVADILADVPPPVGAIRLVARDGTRRIGFKTGTSYGFRDAWTIGFDLLHTVGVWIGRPDGAPLLGAYGVTVAAPLAMRVFNDLPVPASGAGSGRKPLGALASPRALPPRLRRFGPARAAQQSEPVRILFPKQDAQIIGQRGADGKASLPLRVAGGRPPYRWTVLGKDAPPDPESEHELTIADRGQIEVSVRDADGKLDRISFWLD